MLITSCSWWPIFEKSLLFFSFSLLKMNLDEYVLCYASKYRVYFGDNIAKRLAISLLGFELLYAIFVQIILSILFYLFIYFWEKIKFCLFVKKSTQLFFQCWEWSTRMGRNLIFKQVNITLREKCYTRLHPHIVSEYNGLKHERSTCKNLN